MTKNDLRPALVAPGSSILQAVEALNSGSLQIALVVDESRKLLGVMTDGDIRRALLSKHTLDMPVAAVMNTAPITTAPGEDREALLLRMRQSLIHQVPVVDKAGTLLDVLTLDELLVPPSNSNTVVLLAGGRGQRLLPLTENCPKPLLKLGGRPLLESIIVNFRSQGFTRFIISLNYLGAMIRDHFGDGSKWDVDISYVEEENPLGTAGPLSLLPKQTEPFLVMNGDLLTKLNFRSLLDFHIRNGAPATVCAREYEVMVPFGVMQTEGDFLTHVVEKPRQRYLVNAGIYILEPDTVDHVPHNQHFDMPELLSKLMTHGTRPAVFPIYEYWLDVGRPSDFQQANAEYQSVFADLED